MTTTLAKSDLIYHFPQGIPGFETVQEYQLEVESDQSLAQLISSKDKEIGFVLMRPEVVYPDYVKKITLDNETSVALGITDEASADVWVILTLNHKDFSKTTANLRAPILMNPITKLGIQYILNDEQFSSREFIFNKEQALEAQEEGAEG